MVLPDALGHHLKQQLRAYVLRYGSRRPERNLVWRDVQGNGVCCKLPEEHATDVGIAQVKVLPWVRREL